MAQKYSSFNITKDGVVISFNGITEFPSKLGNGLVSYLKSVDGSAEWKLKLYSENNNKLDIANNYFPV